MAGPSCQYPKSVFTAHASYPVARVFYSPATMLTAPNAAVPAAAGRCHLSTCHSRPYPRAWASPENPSPLSPLPLTPTFASALLCRLRHLCLPSSTTSAIFLTPLHCWPPFTSQANEHREHRKIAPPLSDHYLTTDNPMSEPLPEFFFYLSSSSLRALPYEPIPLNRFPSVPRGPGVLHSNTFPADSPLAGGISLVKHDGKKGIGGPLFQFHGLKGSSGPGCFSWPGWVPLWIEALWQP
jgi:hypothetical protein